MLIPQTVEYALRAMACIAVLKKDERSTAKEISAQAGVPIHYLSKILRRLVTAGLIDAQKGPGGGVMLGRKPEDISYLEVFRAMDFMPTKRSCAFGWGMCDETNPCPLHDSWSKLSVEFFKWAEKTTLADVGELSDELIKLRTMPNACSEIVRK